MDIPKNIALQIRHNFCIVNWIYIGYNCKRIQFLEEVASMRLLLVLGVCASFLVAIFTAGYDSKPFTEKN